MALKNKLRELLTEKGMKPADLARESGVSESMISFYLSGKREPMGKTCFKLASALCVSVDELLETGMRSSPQTEKPATETDDGLDEDTKLILNLYKDMTPEHQRLMREHAKLLKNMQNE